MNETSSVMELIDRAARAEEGTTAFALYDGTRKWTVSYPAFARKILEMICFFQEHTIKNQQIALLGANSDRWLEAFLAITASGNTAVLLNPQLPAETLAEQCHRADVTLVCGGEEEIAPLAGHIPCLSYEMLRGKGVSSRVPDLPREATAAMLFTSGTTGNGKIVELTHGNLASSLRSADGVFAAPDIDRILSVLPMFHIAGLRGSLAMLFRYKCLCIGRGAMYLLRDLPVFSPSYVLLVPMMVETLVKLLKNLPDPEKRWEYLGRNLKRICVGGASADPEACRYLRSWGFQIDGGYAMTETAGVGTWGQWDETHWGTIGRLSEELECRIQDGELLFRGPAVMKGYYKDPQATEAVLRDGWLHSGDLGYCDAQGYYYLTGRKKDLIVLPNGEKIHTGTLEQRISRCPGVEECVAYSQGGVLCLEVYAKDPEAVRAWVAEYNGDLPRAFQIEKVIFRTQPLPRTATGKIIRGGENP